MACSTSEAKQFTTCANCEVDNTFESLYSCTMENCSKVGEIYCADCGISSHKRKNHKFDINAEYIAPIVLDVVQSSIKHGLSMVRKTVKTHDELKYGAVRQNYVAATGGIWSGLVSNDLMLRNKDTMKILRDLVKSASGIKDVQQSAILGSTVDIATEASKMAAEGALVGAVIMAGFEITLHTVRFMNGDIESWKEYGYHVAKGVSSSVGMGLGNWGGTTVGVTIGTLVGGPIGALIGGIIGGIIGGLAGTKLSRELFNSIWSDDFIQHKQHGREDMIKTALKLFGILDIKDIENNNIFNEQELKRTYRRLAKKYHPDKNGGSAESHAKFHEINAALGVLLSLLHKKNKGKLVKKLTEVKAIKWKNGIQKLSKLLIEEKLMYIVDICGKWDKRLSIDFLAKMRKEDILEMIHDLNKDEKFEYEIGVVERNQFVNVVQQWSGKSNDILSLGINIQSDEEEKRDDVHKDDVDDVDDIEYDEMEELRDELRKKKVLYILDICMECNEDLTLESLLEYTKTDILEVINEINSDESHTHKIAVVQKNNFAKIVSEFSEKQCESCLSK